MIVASTVKKEKQNSLFFTVLKSHINRKVAYLPHPRGLPGGMVTGKLNNEFVTLLLDLYCFSVLKIDEPKIYGKYGKYKTDFLTKYQI